MKQKLWFNNALFTGIAVALLIFGVMLYISYRQKKQENTTAFLIAQSQENLYQTTRLLSYVTDNETGSRGFLLTGNPVFLEPLLSSKENIYKQISLLHSLNKNNAGREQMIDSLLYFADKRIAFSDSSIKLWQQKGLAAATALVATGRGKIYLDSVRRKIGNITASENALLAERLKTNAREAEQEQVKFLSIAFIVIVLLMLLLWSEKKRIEEKAQKRSRDELEFLSLQIDKANDAIYTLDANRKIKSWNTGAEKLYGFTAQEALGRDSNELLNTVITNNEVMKALIQLDESLYWTGELERKTRTGETVYVTASTTCVKNNEGSVAGYVSVSRDITTQRKMNEQLNHLADIVERSSEAIFSRGVDQRIISWNNGAEQLLGFNRAEVIGKTFSDLGILKQTPEEIRQTEMEIIQKGSRQSEKTFYGKNGTSFYGAVTANSNQNQKGEIVSFNFIVKDISRRRELENELRRINEELETKVEERTKAIIEKERKYRYLFENNPLPMWVIDTDSFKFLDVNETALRHYGYSREEFLTMTAVDIRPDEEKERFSRLSRSGDLNAADINFGVWHHIKKDKSLIAVEINSHPIIFENRVASLVLVNDVTEKNKAEEKLALSEKRFRALVENNYDIISLMDASFKVIYRSPSATRITGWTDEEINDTPSSKTIHPDDLEESARIGKEIYNSPGKPVKTLFRTRHKQGHYLWMEGIVTNRLYDETVQAVVFNFRDVTESIEASKKLASSELRFRSLIENSAEGISLLDAESNIIYRSPSGYKMLGNTPANNTTSHKEPADAAAFKIKFDESLSKPGIPVPYNVKYLHATGRPLYASGVFTNLLHVEGVNAIVANYHDVTDQIEAENKTVSSERRFRTLVEKNQDVIMLLDASFNVTYRSPSATLVNGWTDEDVKDINGISNIHPDDKEYAAKIIGEMMANPGKVYDVIFRNRHKNGSFRWLEGAATNLLNDPDVNAILFNFRDVTERIEADEKLKASEEQFRYSMDNMLEGIQIVGLDWKYIYVNKTLCRQGKYTKEELIGFTMMEKYPGIEASALFSSCQRCMAEGISLHLENEFEFPDKSKGWFELSIQPVPEGLFILSVDITGRKRIEEEIKYNEKRFRSLIENISDAIVLNDPATKILYQSPSVMTILGYSPEERVQKRVLDYIHPDSHEEFTALYKKLAETPGTPMPFQYRAKHKNGHYVWLEGVVTNLLNEPEVNGYVANYRDVTKKKELEERLNKAYTMARIGVWEIDMQKQTVYWSDITREIHETSPDYIPNLETGINFYKEGPGRELIREKVTEAMENGKSWDVELQIITAKNNERWIRSIGETEFNDGKCVRVYGTFQDIDDLKRTEEMIRRLNLELEEKILIRTAQLRKSNEELEAFSYSVSHDLRAPLRAIIGYTTILQEDYSNDLDEEAQRITGIIKNNTQRMGILIDDLLAFSRVGKQELLKATISSVNLVEEVIKTLAYNHGSNGNINWIIHNLPPVEADSSSLRQVWVNLISNAVKYSGKNPQPVIEIGSYQENKKVVFYVKDNGVGFNEKYKSKLFKVFQRLHSTEEFEGTGIGLAIVDKIVSKHGGTVWSEAAVNSGATFYFSIPLSTELN